MGGELKEQTPSLLVSPPCLEGSCCQCRVRCAVGSPGQGGCENWFPSSQEAGVGNNGEEQQRRASADVQSELGCHSFEALARIECMGQEI